MSAKTVTISDEVAAVLRRAETNGASLTLVGQLDRKLYEQTNKVLEALGGKWNKKSRVHLFDGDAEALIAEALSNGHVVDTKKTFEQFDTPPALAERMIAMAEIGPHDIILEPSAGNGALIRPLGKRRRIVAVEIDPARQWTLRFLSVTLHIEDFLVFSARWRDDASLYDVVLMNPPFSGNQDIAHVEAAWRLLRAGGRLVAIISPHSSFSSDAASVAFREWLAVIGATVEDLPAGTFGASGTQVRAQLIFARRQAHAV